MKITRLLTLISFLIGVLVLTFVSFNPGSAEMVANEEQLVGETHTLTLITGDKVIASESEDGLLAINIEPVEREGYEAKFEKIERDGNVYVYPVDIMPYLSTKIDRELFNITELIRQEYTDEMMDAIPVIVSLNESNSLNAESSKLSDVLTEERTFTSINGQAGKISKDETGAVMQALFTTTKKGKKLNSSPLLENNIEKIHLDYKVSVDLEESVPQIGAPTAWEADYDGTDVVVAVLDTGIDKEHPDLQGKVIEEVNYSDDDTMMDTHGHGTHVASTIAGSGDASGGERKGVAPGASLVNVKIIDESGTGASSDIIAGMEWAAQNDVDIINMSVGSGPTDGTDVMSQALNNLTEEYGVLFVVSSGNDGPGEETVTAPGAADQALTVGSVDKSDKLSSTSSRGPRIEDAAVKPNITAPGVSINAARAEGTSMGIPIDDYYTTASGTSMAAPHTAGSAALILNKWKSDGKELSPEALKTILVSTAAPNEENTVYEQGGGRVDIEQALEQEIYPNTDSISLGSFEYPHDEHEKVTEKITYQNSSDADVTLDLSVELESNEGGAVPNDMLQLKENEISIEAGGEQEVEITLDPTLGKEGIYSGYLYAQPTDESFTIQTPIGFYKEHETYTLTIKGITEDGKPVKSSGPSSLDVINVDDREIFGDTYHSWDEEGEIEMKVPKGSYSAMAGMAIDFDSNRFTMMGNPEFDVTEDTTIILDAREANEIKVEIDDNVEFDYGTIAYYRRAEETDYGLSHTYFSGWGETYAGTTDPVEKGDFEFLLDWEYMTPEDSDDKPSWYKLLFPEESIPSDLTYKVEKDDLAQFNTKYHSQMATSKYTVYQHRWRPYELGSMYNFNKLDMPLERMEYITPGDTRYTKQVAPDTTDSFFTLDGPMQQFEKGKQPDVDWMKAPLHPGITESDPDSGVYREGNYLNIVISEYLDSAGNWAYSDDESEFKLFEENELLAEADQPRGKVQLSSDDAEYRMELTTSADAQWTPFSSETNTTWTFNSNDQEQIVPLLMVDYDLDSNLTNTASLPEAVNGMLPITLQVNHQLGAQDIPIEGAKLWISYNDGDDWEKATLERSGNDFTAHIADRKDNRDGSGYISLKVEAWDTEGNSIAQEITRAYQWNFEGDINGNDMIDIHDVIRAVAHYGTDNEQADINGDGIVDEKDMRILEKNFMKVGPEAGKHARPMEKLGKKGINDFLRAVGLEPMG